LGNYKIFCRQNFRQFLFQSPFSLLLSLTCRSHPAFLRVKTPVTNFWQFGAKS
jgi:hypothetical protein